MPLQQQKLLPVGFTQITGITNGAAVGLGTIPRKPAGTGLEANCAIIQAEGASIRWRDDGTDPTASVGERLLADQDFMYTGNMKLFKAIAIGANAILNVSFYRG